MPIILKVVVFLMWVMQVCKSHSKSCESCNFRNILIHIIVSSKAAVTSYNCCSGGGRDAGSCGCTGKESCCWNARKAAPPHTTQSLSPFACNHSLIQISIVHNAQFCISTPNLIPNLVLCVGRYVYVCVRETLRERERVGERKRERDS